MPFSFLNRDALDALYGTSPDGVMVECFEAPISFATLKASDPPVEITGIGEIVYVNLAFLQQVRNFGIDVDGSDKAKLRNALLNRFDDDLNARWRTRPGIHINNVPLAPHIESQQRQPTPLMLSATPISHDGKVHGCRVRLTDASPALTRDAEEHRALRQIEAFVLTENVPLICLEFATPLPKQVSSGELSAAYLSSTITHITHSAAQLFEITPAQVLNKPLNHASSDGITALMTNAFPAASHAKLLNLGDTSEILVPTTTPARTVYRVKPTFVFEEGCAVEAWLRIEDETKKQRRARHQKKLDRTRTMALEGASLYQFEIDCDSMVIHADIKGLEAMGFSATTTNLNEWLELIESESLSISREQMLRQIKGEEKTLNFVVRLQNSAAEERHIELWGEAVPPDDGKSHSTRILGLFRDVSETEKLNTRLRDKKTLESLGVLAGGVAHDFNNMLMSVLGYAELMEADMLEAPQCDRSPLIQSSLENVAEIRTAALRASELCTSLLAYAGQHLIEKKSLDLTELVRSTAELVQLTMSKRAPLEWQLNNEVRISADQGQLTQVIVNLVGNAADAMDPGKGGTGGDTGGDTGDSDQSRAGAVQISVDTIVLSAAERAELEEPIGEPDEPIACLTVRDSGIGMTQDTLQRMYEPFFTTKTEGRGLGMAAVHGIVRHHGGGILVDSVVDHGTEFRVCFPLAARTPTVEHNIATEETTPANKQPSVLVVDDENTVRRIAAEMLRHLQCEVQEADSAEAALALFDTYQFDYVLLDITMPVMSGDELAAILLERHPDLNVVLCSGFTEKNVSGSLLKRCTFIHKPFTLQEIRDALSLDDKQHPAISP